MITVSIEDLQKFNLFSDFTELQCAYIKENAKKLDVPANKILLKLGAEHTNIFLLLEGELKLRATDGKEGIIAADSSSAKNSIAQLRPSRYQVSTLTEVKIIVLSEDILNQAIAMEDAEEIEIDAISVDEMDNHNEAYDTILFDILSLLHTDKLILPSLPDIALKIRHTVENEDSDADEITKIINMDQSIVTKILKTANSVIYNTSGKKIESVKAAYLRIGSKKLVNLVLSYAMKELFNSDSALIKTKMKEVWQQSVKVAAISSILARLTPGFDPEKALLAGLLHNIGSVAVLNNLGDQHQSMMDSPEIMDNVLYGLQSEVGQTLLEKWEFPDDLVDVVKHSTDWYRDENEDADYSDIINIAQLHAYIGTHLQEKLPNIDETPAFKKLALGQLTPELSLQVLEKSQEDINQTIALFN
ncbi:MAG: HDOD domain-containing protein [Pseudomonadota bacterium]